MPLVSSPKAGPSGASVTAAPPKAIMAMIRNASNDKKATMKKISMLG